MRLRFAVAAVGVLASACVSMVPQRTGPAPRAEPAPRTEPALRPDPARRIDASGRSRAADLVAAARALLGTPYRYGGSSRSGFDCSGLVQFAHRAVGLELPRTAAAQRSAAMRVPLDAIEAGDLLFFSMTGTGIDHVGVYVGERRFIHAPTSGRAVTYAALDEPHYAARLVSAGRFWSSSHAAAQADAP